MYAFKVVTRGFNEIYMSLFGLSGSPDIALTFKSSEQ